MVIKAIQITLPRIHSSTNHYRNQRHHRQQNHRDTRTKSHCRIQLYWSGLHVRRKRPRACPRLFSWSFFTRVIVGTWMSILLARLKLNIHECSLSHAVHHKWTKENNEQELVIEFTLVHCSVVMNNALKWTYGCSTSWSCWIVSRNNKP